MLEEQSEEDWDRVMGVNSTGTFLGIKHAVPEMRKAGGGSIINISSVYGLVGSASGAAYPASKGAVRILSKSAAVQYAKEGIRVNSVHPGFIETPQSASLMNDPVARQKLVDRTPIGRIGTSGGHRLRSPVSRLRRVELHHRRGARAGRRHHGRVAKNGHPATASPVGGGRSRSCGRES